MGKTKIGGVLLAIFATLQAINPDALPAALGPVPGVVKAVTVGLGTVLAVFGIRDAIAKNGAGK